MKKTFWFGWWLLATFCVLHYIYTIFKVGHSEIINIEHLFYALLLLLPAVSILNISKGKALLFLLFFWGLSCIYLIPEFDEVVALESCYDGKCEPALKMGIVKISNDRIVYIPQEER